jgi:16S rRNA processing protein RimM
MKFHQKNKVKKKSLNSISETNDFFYLGKIIKTHGIHGELSGFVDADDPLVYSEIHGVFIETKQGLLPYVFEELSIEQNGYCLIKIKGIDTIDEGRRFTGKRMFLPLSMLPALADDQFYFHEITGFSVIDETQGNIGFITGVIDHAVQPLLQVLFQNKEIFIPIHDDIIVRVDKAEKKMYVKTPDGLIDIYINSE